MLGALVRTGSRAVDQHRRTGTAMPFFGAPDQSNHQAGSLGLNIEITNLFSEIFG